MATTISKEVRDKIVVQAINEMSFARRHKQGKVRNWQLNEDLYYGNKKKSEESRANVDLGQMQEHIHTLLSKIDNPLTFKFEKRKESQTKRVARLNALKDFDADRDNWDIKDIAGKKQAILYGRAIYAYAAHSHDSYKPQLDNVDVYDFLIDPSAGGIDIEKARFMGRYGVVKDRYELEGNKMYISTQVKSLLEGKGNNTERPQEELNKQNRVYANKHEQAQKETQSDDKFKFWEWYTTFQGKRYYLLLSETGACAIRIEELSSMFKTEMWPFWTYAPYPDLTEFWTPSPADYVRELIMAQAVSINQMLDNAERVNKPQRIIDVSAIQNLAELKYRRDGYIKANPGTSQNAVKILETPSINTPLEVFKQLESIKQQASGVTASALGVADTDGRATIYEGNEQNTADRFGLFNKSYSFGYRRFGHLYMNGVDEHLKKKVAVDILGPEGIEVEKFSRTDIFRNNDEFAVIVEASNVELSLSEQKKRNQGAFFASLLGRPDLANQKVVIEQMGQVAGLEPERIRQLLQLDMYGNAELMSEAEHDIEQLLDGQLVKPNRKANAAYKQRFVDYMMDHQDDMDQEQFNRMVLYVQSLDQVIINNTMREAREQAQRELNNQQPGAQKPPQLRMPGPSQPLQDTIQQNLA